MSEIVLEMTMFWGLLVAILGIIAVSICVAADANDELFYVMVGVTSSGTFITLIGLVMAILDAILRSSKGVA